MLILTREAANRDSFDFKWAAKREACLLQRTREQANKSQSQLVDETHPVMGMTSSFVADGDLGTRCTLMQNWLEVRNGRRQHHRFIGMAVVDGKIFY